MHENCIFQSYRELQKIALQWFNLIWFRLIELNWSELRYREIDSHVHSTIFRELQLKRLAIYMQIACYDWLWCSFRVENTLCQLPRLMISVVIYFRGCHWRMCDLQLLTPSSLLFPIYGARFSALASSASFAIKNENLFPWFARLENQLRGGRG